VEGTFKANGFYLKEAASLAVWLQDNSTATQDCSVDITK
jgi:hypothetical protein